MKPRLEAAAPWFVSPGFGCARAPGCWPRSASVQLPCGDGVAEQPGLGFRQQDWSHGSGVRVCLGFAPTEQAAAWASPRAF